MRIRLLVVTLLIGLTGLDVDAEIVCRKKSGVMVVRDACRRKETPVELAQFGAVGPKGDPGEQGEPGSARAYACSETLDEITPSLCSGRAVKGITSVVANSEYDGYTCFVLEPSIDANTAVVVASLGSGVFGGGKINAIVAAFAAQNYFGCPPNSVVVVTARHTNESLFLGLEPVVLPVNVAVM